MKRSLSTYENEIVHQIILAELCLVACEMTPVIAGQGENFNSYFYNLNISKAIGTLHSLLRPTQKETSLLLYIKGYEKQISTRQGYEDFCAETSSLIQCFKNELSNMRHKVVSHIDPGFKHTDFTTGYMLPEKLPILIEICSKLKESFFRFTNHAPYMGHENIRKKIALVIEDANKESLARASNSDTIDL